MSISQVHIYYPSPVDLTGATTGSQTTTAFDLRMVISWSNNSTYGSNVRIRGFPPEVQMFWNKAEFETAKALSLAATGG